MIFNAAMGMRELLEKHYPETATKINFDNCFKCFCLMFNNKEEQQWPKSKS